VPHRLQDSFFRAVFNSRVAGIAVVDIASRCVIATNDKMREVLGRSREEIEGIADAWRDFTPSEYHHLDERAIAQFLEHGQAETFEKEYLRPDESRVPVRVSTSSIEGEKDLLVVFVQDISDERAAREREQQIRMRLEIALSAADQGVWDWDLTTNEMVYSDRAKEIYGLPIDEPVTFEVIRDATHPDDLKRTIPLLERAIDPAIRDRSSYEYRILRPDGTICWALAYGEAVFEGEPGREKAVRYAGTIQDITHRKAAERHQKILIAELNHRVKNVLAIVQALAHQTFKDRVPESLANAFSGRLSALAAAHSILTKSKWEAAKVKDLAEAVLQPHLGDRQRISLDGDDSSVPPQLAVNIAMALHELSTNAVKYGALSHSDGRVELRWQVAQHSEPRLHLEWREHDGPPVEEPMREGFGTRMLKRIVTSELKGKVKLDFSPDGLDCSIEVPVQAQSGLTAAE